MTVLLKHFSFKKEAVVPMPNIVQRLAAELDVKARDLTLTAKKGERVIFGCSSKIRHHLSPDQKQHYIRFQI